MGTQVPALLLALPWLCVFSLGPSPVVLQTLVSAMALLVVLGWAWWAAQQDPDAAAGELRAAVAYGWLLAALLSTAMALLQYFDWADGLQPWVSESHGVAFANLRQRNQFATLTLLGWSAAVCLMAQARAGWGRLGLFLAAALLLAGTAASHSRTGLMGLPLLLSLLALWWRFLVRSSRWLVLASLPLYVGWALVLPHFGGVPGEGWGALGRLAEGDAACSSRLTLWRNVLHLMAERPWTGWGIGELDYAHFITLFPGERFCAILDNAHNLPLHLAVEMGLPLAVLLCGAVVIWVLRQRPWAERAAPRQLAWMALAVLGLHSMLEYPLWYGPFQLAALLSIWLLLLPVAVEAGSNAHADSKKIGKFRQYASRLFAPIFVAIGMVALAAVAWDYWRISQLYLAAEQRSPAFAADPLGHARQSRLFAQQVQFAELTLTPLTQDNALSQYRLAQQVLHFSPEPRVIERVLEAALLLRRDEDVAFFLRRYQAAFPDASARWLQQQTALPTPQGSPQSSPTSRRASPTSARR